ncbi:uncharacterized protein LOC127732484 [Mytilus californianus]|uniref:uncharacterized protein LOC127732484 n=1 Tax=Mytilus californianus TaxID=6549 RepID=UPI002245D847|nr:uncharacterized protein LOC127732484 [Mytilus californianus]
MNGEILSYLINYNILPSFKVYTIVVKGNQSFALIPFGDHIGQLFLISLQAENDYGLSKQSIPRYIRAVKNSKPPANITLSHLGNVILVTWSTPPGNHLPITSYKLCYKPLPHYSKICIIVLANRGNRFIINTQGHNACSKSIKVNPRQIINITSPGYSRKYPPGLSFLITTKEQQCLPFLRLYRPLLDIK